MLPVNFLRHTSTYNLDLNGVQITAKVAERYVDLRGADVALLRSKLDSNFPIVGIDLKYTMPADSKGPHPISILVLCVQDYCLVVKLGTKSSYYSDSLSLFFEDESICFLGWGQELFEKVKLIRGFEDSALNTCVNVSSLAERVLRNKEIMEGCSNLEDLASKVGVHITPAQAQAKKKEFDLDGNAFFYTEKEVKYAVEDAFKCYTIGTHLMKLNS